MRYKIVCVYQNTIVLNSLQLSTHCRLWLHRLAKVAAYDVPVQAGMRTKNTCMESRHIPTIQHRHTYTPSMTPKALGPYPLPQLTGIQCSRHVYLLLPCHFYLLVLCQLSGERRVMLGLQASLILLELIFHDKHSTFYFSIINPASIVGRPGEGIFFIRFNIPPTAYQSGLHLHWSVRRKPHCMDFYRRE
jgi:hypothetical protein